MQIFKLSSISKSLLVASGFLFTHASIANVVSSIHPIGFIAQAITDGVVEHKVLAPSSSSPHDYAMKPSDVKLLNDAKLVIWVNEDLEAFLAKPMSNKAANEQLKLSEVAEINALISRDEDAHGHEDKAHDAHEHGEHAHEDKAHDAHEHGAHAHEDKAHDAHEHGEHAHEDKAHDEHGHDHSTDWHIWMSPDISVLAAENIATRLISLYPEKKEKIEENLEAFKANMTQTLEEVSLKLNDVKDKPYYVFHDAYGYYESEFGLHREGEFTINPTIMPGVQQLTEIKNKLKTQNISCIFKEPQFTPNVINAVIQGTEVKVGELDPVGGDIQLSKNAYFEFLNLLADNYVSCLK